MRRILLILFSLSFIISNNAYDIMKDMQDKDLSKSVKATFSMKTVTQKGKIKSLDFISWSKNNGNEQMQIIWFIAPPSFKGVSFLKRQKNKSTNMTMWHPKYGKTRKISSQDKGNSFMNSELTYEDLYIRNIDYFNYTLIKEENISRYDCYVIESIPNKDTNSSYLKHRTWISKKNLIPIKELSYNLDGILYKKKKFYYNNENKIDSIKIENLKKRRYTILSFKTLDTDTEINDNVFIERNLKRVLK